MNFCNMSYRVFADDDTLRGAGTAARAPNGARPFELTELYLTEYPE